MSKGTLLVPSRRRILHFGMAGVGTTFLAGCAGMGGLAGNLMGGGEKVDWTTLGKEFAANLKKIADQTDQLLLIQAMYLDSYGLKDLAKKLKAEAANLKKGDSFGASDLDTATILSTEAANAVADKIRESGQATAQQKKVLEKGQAQHAQAIRNMWGGVLGIGVTLAKATNAAPPSISDVALFDVFKEITQTGPKALAFGETSKSTYDEYVKAFEYAGYYTPPSERLTDLSAADIS